MANASHIHVRPLEIGDFEFVRDLASQQRGFTIPPVYVLWLLLRIKGSICLAAEHSTKGQLAYLLSVPMQAPKHSVFVWQLAAISGPDGSKATQALLIEFRKRIKKFSTRNIFFSTVPRSAAFRAIRRCALSVFSQVPGEMNRLPFSVAPKETEFLLNLK
jgi:hypothetical protein